MNGTQPEHLFTDLTPAQAETIAAGVTINAGKSVDASYGKALVGFGRTGSGSFEGNLFVKDKVKDGLPVYAKFHGLTSDGRTLIGSTKFFDLEGAAGPGTNHNGFKVSFGNVNIERVRVAIYRRNRPGFVAGDWAKF